MTKNILLAVLTLAALSAVPAFAGNCETRQASPSISGMDDLRDRIASGEFFTVRMEDTVGDLAFGSTYDVHFNPGLGTFTTSGITTGGEFVEKDGNLGDPYFGTIDLWGNVLRYEQNGELTYHGMPVGRMYF